MLIISTEFFVDQKKINFSGTQNDKTFAFFENLKLLY